MRMKVLEESTNHRPGNYLPLIRTLPLLPMERKKSNAGEATNYLLLRIALFEIRSQKIAT